MKLILFEKSRGIGIRFFNLYDMSPETLWELRSIGALSFRVRIIRISDVTGGKDPRLYGDPEY